MEPRTVMHVSMPTSEGVAAVVLTYVRDQVARGWSVVVVCPTDGWLAPAAAAAGARVLAWQARRAPGLTTPRETRRLAALIAQSRPDLVHLHSSKAGLAGRLAVRGSRPTVFQPHAWSFLAVAGPLRLATLAWERHAVRWTHGFVLVSRAERVAGHAAGVLGPTWVVPNGVDLLALSPAGSSERADARAQLGLGDEPLAVCVGRLSLQKGQDLLLDAWPEVRRALPTATLALVGGGPERAGLEQRAVPGVLIPGDRRDVPDWLAAANVVVAPSRWEGMALVPIEAMARARCVIATDVAGAAEALPAAAGTIVAVGDTAMLARAIIERLTDLRGSDQAGLIGRQHVMAHHDAAFSAAAIVSVYDSLWTPS